MDENKLNLLTEKEELLKSLSEETIKRNIFESRFSDWQSSKLKDLAKVVSEETAAEAQQVELCRQREGNRMEIARLELDQKELARKLIDTEETNVKSNIIYTLTKDIEETGSDLESI